LTATGAFSALTLLVGRQEGHPACKKTEWWSAGVVICLDRGADLHMAQLMPLPVTVSLASVKSRLVLPFWYRQTGADRSLWPVSTPNAKLKFGRPLTHSATDFDLWQKSNETKAALC